LLLWFRCSVRPRHSHFQSLPRPLHRLAPCSSGIRSRHFRFLPLRATWLSRFSPRIHVCTTALPLGALIRLIPNEGCEFVFVEEVAVGSFARLRGSRLHEPDVLETLAEEHGDADGDGASSLDDQGLQSLARSRSTRATRTKFAPLTRRCPLMPRSVPPFSSQRLPLHRTHSVAFRPCLFVDGDVDAFRQPTHRLRRLPLLGDS
jgi:hypothetical protein